MRRRLTATATALFLAGTALSLAAPAQADTAPNGVIAYTASNVEADFDIYTMDPAAPEVPPIRMTIDGQYNDNPDWSPDGTKIVYDGWTTILAPRIQVMDADPATNDHVRISEACSGEDYCGGDYQPAWSPDGTRIAFISNRPDPDGTAQGGEVYVMDATGEVGPLPDATRLTTDPVDEFTGAKIVDSQVTWSPDGSRIAWVSRGRGLDFGNCDIWTMDSQDLDGDGFGDDLEQVTFDENQLCDAFEDVTPAWSPDSSLIVFASWRSGTGDIWLVDAENPSDLRNVTVGFDFNADQPSWSADGTQIIFRSYLTGAYELYSLPVPPPGATDAAPRPTRLTFSRTNEDGADWGALFGSQVGTRTLTVGPHTNGVIRSSDRTKIDCGRDCTATFVRGATVTVTAVPRPGYVFVRWGGACTGTASTCTFRLGADKVVGAKFVRSG